jgi:hypothetical protein
LCDPVTAVIGALSGAAALFGGGNKTSTPPPATMPATTATGAYDPGADVRVGDGATKTSTTNAPQYDGFTATRVVGKPLGGLGRGGLGL